MNVSRGVAAWGWLDDDVGRLGIDRVYGLVGRQNLFGAVHGQLQAVRLPVMLP